MQMTRLFRSKSYGPVGQPEFFNPALSGSPFFVKKNEEDSDKDEKMKNMKMEMKNRRRRMIQSNPVSTPSINPCLNAGKAENQHQFGILDFVVAVLKKFLVTCNVERDDVCSLDISSPIEVCHVPHATFDRFNGFLGLPRELESEVPKRVSSTR